MTHITTEMIRRAAKALDNAPVNIDEVRITPELYQRLKDAGMMHTVETETRPNSGLIPKPRNQRRPRRKR